MATSIRDPIHGSILLQDNILPIVDHAVMQRLRRVAQLGTAHLVYPGAHHKRFEHSLGAYHLAGRLADGLQLGDDDQRLLQAAALLHDIGHGPFSHAFEELLKEIGRRHEETTVDLVQWGPMADLLRQADLDPVAIADAVVGKGPLAGLVSGSLDADRMDYLLRDAHYTGVGSNVDPDRLAGVVRLDPESGVVLRESGIIAAEALLTTRFLMYPAVYLHHTVRSSEQMLLEAVRSYVDAGHATLAELERETDDGLLWRLRQVDGVPQQLAKALDDRRLYKRAYEVQPSPDGDLESLSSDTERRRGAQREIAEAAGVEVHEAILDAPHPPKFRELGLHVDRGGEVVPLPEASRLVRALEDARLDHWRLRVFAPADKQDAVRKAAEAALG